MSRPAPDPTTEGLLSCLFLVLVVGALVGAALAAGLAGAWLWN